MTTETPAAPHSRFAPSSAEIWMNCAGALNLIDELDLEGKADHSTNEYAAYGTVAHEIAAVCLNNQMDAWEFLGEERTCEGWSFVVDEEMERCIQLYLDVVREDLRKYGGTLYVEERAVLDMVDPDCGGTMDAGFLGADDVARVYDLKTGFVLVDAYWNKQALIYGLELLLKVLNKKQLKACKGVELIIVQPNGFGDKFVKRFEISKADLLKWKAEQLEPAIKLTYDPKAPLVFGSWCTQRYCPALAHCPRAQEKASQVIEAAQIKDPDSMNGDEIGELLELRKVVEKFFKLAEARGYGLLLKGQAVPGQKLVQAEGRRAWVAGAADSVPEDLADQGFKRELLTPAQFEKLGPKAKEFVAEWAAKPQKGLTMASADDKRPAVKAEVEDPNTTFAGMVD